LDVDVVGTFGEKYFGVDVRALYWGNPYLRLVLGVSLFASLIWLCIDSLRARKFGSFLFTLPSLYLIGIQALVTHFIPRYGVPLLPVLYACLCIALFEAGVRLLRRNRERVAAG
jgi:hypothetical protein